MTDNGRPELSTEETRGSLVERLRAMAVAVAMEPGGDETTAKFIFDLRAAGDALEGLEQLLALVLVEMAAATNRDLACDGDVGDEEGKVWGKIEELAGQLREQLDKANPEPKVA